MHCCSRMACLKGTSTKHSLHNIVRVSSSSLVTCTNPPPAASKEYRDVDARDNKLEQREHIRECDPSSVDSRNRLTGLMGSRSLLDEEVLRTPVSASTVSHLRRLARLAADRTRLLLLPFRRTSGTEEGSAEPEFRRRVTNDLRPGIARKLRRCCGCGGG